MSPSRALVEDRRAVISSPGNQKAQHEDPRRLRPLRSIRRQQGRQELPGRDATGTRLWWRIASRSALSSCSLVARCSANTSRVICAPNGPFASLLPMRIAQRPNGVSTVAKPLLMQGLRSSASTDWLRYSTGPTETRAWLGPPLIKSPKVTPMKRLLGLTNPNQVTDQPGSANSASSPNCTFACSHAANVSPNTGNAASSSPRCARSTGAQGSSGADRPRRAQLGRTQSQP